MLRLFRRYLQAEVMGDEGWLASGKGTLQGSPVSPLPANVMLDDLDAELERRGHRFVRYADDLRVYVASERAGQRVASITQFIEQRLKLRVNRRKSGGRAGDVPTLSRVRVLPSRRHRQDRRQPEVPARAKDRLRELTGRIWGVSMDGRIHAIIASRLDGRPASRWPTRSARSQPESTDPRGESRPQITAQRRSAAFEGSTLRVRRRSTLDRAGSRDSSATIGGFRLRPR